MDRLIQAIRRKFGIQYPKPTTEDMARIIYRINALGRRATDAEWSEIVYSVCGSNNLLLMNSQDFSDLNALLAQATTGL
jgi:hypothetical protein